MERFVNNKGHPDSNKELDRELEHRNKYVKEQIKSFRGKVTDDVINRWSRSDHTALFKISLTSLTKRPFIKSNQESILYLIGQKVLPLAHMFENEQIFDNIGGRSYQHFSGTPENYALKLDMTKVHTWAKSRSRNYKKKK